MRRFIAILSLICLILSTGCDIPRGVSREEIEQKNADFDKLTHSRIVSITEGPYVGASPVAIPTAIDLPAGIFSRIITVHRTADIDELCAVVSKLTGLLIAVEAPSRAEIAEAKDSASLDAQVRIAMATQGGGTESMPPLPFSTSAKRNKIRVDYEGSVKGFLDMLAAKTGLGWEYSSDIGVVFASNMVKTFTIWAVPGNVKFSDKISNAVGKTSGSSSSISGSVTSTEAENESSQKHSTEFDFNIWKEVESGVKSMLSPSGKVSITQASGTVTVSDNVAVLRNVGKFIDELNSRLARQVALSIKVYSVEVNDSLEAGLDLSLLFETGDAVVSAGAMPLGLLGLGGEISATVVDGKLKDSGAMLKALRSIGQATQVTSGGAIVMSNQSVPIHALQRVAYLASSSISTTDYGQTTDLTPGEITTGFSMSVVPHVLGGRRLILYYSINLSSLEGITNFESGGSRVQLPQVASRAFSQRMNLKLGQTVVLAGFEQVVDSDGNNAGLMGFGKSRGYKKSLMIITIATESGVQNG